MLGDFATYTRLLGTSTRHQGPVRASGGSRGGRDAVAAMLREGECDKNLTMRRIWGTQCVPCPSRPSGTPLLQP